MATEHSKAFEVRPHSPKAGVECPVQGLLQKNSNHVVADHNLASYGLGGVTIRQGKKRP